MSAGEMRRNPTPAPCTREKGESRPEGETLLHSLALGSGKRSDIALRRVSPRLFVLAFLNIYRFAVSPVLHALIGPACRFEPSCSRFASDAIRVHGVMRGGAMALRRLARCHPLGGQGYDPVPAKRS
jgi:putative membrane protein insertion efficiency factor